VLSTEVSSRAEVVVKRKYGVATSRERRRGSVVGVKSELPETLLQLGPNLQRRCLLNCILLNNKMAE